MTEKHPEEIETAANLFKRFESSQDHSQRTRDFGEAIEMLNAHLDAYPDSPHRSYICNIKKAYSRKLLEQLPSLCAVSFDDWFFYMALLLVKVSDKVELLTQENKAYRDNLRHFLEIRKDEAISLLSLRKKQGQRPFNGLPSS